MKSVETKFWVGDTVDFGGMSAIITGLLYDGGGVQYQCSFFYEERLG